MDRRNRPVRALLALCVCVGLLAALCLGADWPMYRHDAARSGATAQELAGQLHLQWVRQLPPRHAAMSYDRRMEHDNGYQPVVVGKTVLVALEYNNSLLAVDSDTGQARWTFYVEGPIRYAPAAWDGRVYVAPEDGRLYCIDAAAGKLLWRYDGAPSARKILNHERLTSNWSTSCGPVVHLGMVFFGTGVWPIDGTFCHAVDATTGQKVWRSRSAVCWGYATVVRNWAVLPSGKFPSIYDVSTGAGERSRGYDVKNLPTASVAAWRDTHLFNGNKAYALVPGEPTYKTYANAEHQVAIWTPVIDGHRIYGFNDGILKAYRKPTADELKTTPRKGLVQFGGEWYVRSRPDYAWARSVGEEIPLPKGVRLPEDWYPRRMEMKAGRRLFASGPGAVIAIDSFGEGSKPSISWVGQVKGRVTAVLAADGKLFITCEGGKVFCYGPRKVEPRTHEWPGPAPAPPADETTRTAGAILGAAKQREGYCYVWRLTDGRLAEELRRRTGLRVIAVDGDEKKVNALRGRFDAAGILDRRLVLMAGDPQTFEFPPYTANLIVSEDIDAAMAAGPSFVERVFAALRPYGGAACFATTDDRHAKLADWVKRLELPGGDLRRADGLTVLVRKGPLPGAADWTHERRDQANTICTPDTAIRPPMGLLWWGGPAAEWRRCYIAFIPPGLEVVDGRYIMQGHGLLSAVDVYTGRLLWEKDIPRLQYYGAYIEEFMRDGNGNPLYPEPDSEAWRKGHAGLLTGEIEIAKLSGNAFNVVSMPDAIYMTVAEKLWAIDPDTGETVRTFDFPFKDPQARRPLCWGNLRIEGDVIVATAFDPQDIRDSFGAWFQGNEKNKQRMQMRWLMAVNRRTGKLLWKRRAAGGFLNHAFALGNGRVFCVDAVSQPVMEAYEKVGRKLTPAQPSVQALDLTSGVQLWHKPLDVYVPTINYSVPRDILLLPARSSTCWEDGRWVSRDAPAGKGKKAGDSVVLAWRGKDGKLLWQAKDLHFAEPVMMCRDMLISRHGNTLNLLDGKPIRRPDPLTGQVRAWGPSAGGCNFLIGSEYLSTHRICYDDLRYQCTVPLPGMRSGCTPSILPANGAMTVFNYSGNYPSDELRSAYVLVHRPQNANYTSFGAGRGADSIQRFLSAGLPARRLGLNFGAPGDLMGLDGTPWLAQGKPGPPAEDRRGKRVIPASIIRLEPAATVETFCLHPAAIQPTEGGWAPVAASGFKGAERIEAAIVPGAAKGAKPIRYAVRLHFAEPEPLKAGERLFNVSIQGREVLKGFDVVKAAGGPRRAIARRFEGVEVADVLKISLTPVKGKTVICGVEVIAEK